ncbi:MAG: SET domain-containing protein-lysine N-methyltransferase [Alphaproteobacteria bacterium]
MTFESNPLRGSSDQRKLLNVHYYGPGKGRGVLAGEDIAKGELIERSPVLIIPDADRAGIDPSIIFTYIFMWEHDTVEEDLYKHKGRAGIALGYTSLLNHSYTPNADFVRHIDHDYLDIVALRDIKTGEEITIDYQMTLWFTP